MSKSYYFRAVCLYVLPVATVFYYPGIVHAATIIAGSGALVLDDPGRCFTTSFCTASTPTITTVSPNNDEAGITNGNTVTQTFVAAPQLIIAMTYLVTNSGGTTEYRFTDTVWNNWDFSYGLWGHEVILETALSNPGSGLDFDFPDRDPLPSVTDVFITGGLEVHTPDNIKWGFATFRHGDATLGYSLDLPDCGIASGIACDAGIDSYNVTILHEFSVPIPAAVWLFGSGLLGLTGIARRKKAA